MGDWADSWEPHNFDDGHPEWSGKLTTNLNGPVVHVVKMKNFLDFRERLDSTIWTDREGIDHDVSSISHKYALNLIKFIEPFARALHDEECVQFMSVPEPSADMASYYFEQEMDILFRQDSLEWLQDTTLMRALYDRVEATKP
jgi:hypothetical protein